MKRKLSLVIISGLLLGAIFSYSSVFALESNTDTISSDIEKKEEARKNIGEMVFGKVTAIDGNTITIATANMPLMNLEELPERGREKPERPDERPEKIESDLIENSGEKPERPKRELSENEEDRVKEMDFTGEEITITVSDESILKKRSRRNKDINTDEQEALNISDIKVGDVLNILYSNSDDENKEIKEILVKSLDTSEKEE